MKSEVMEQSDNNLRWACWDMRPICMSRQCRAWR